MDRRKTTEFLSNLLIKDKLSGPGKHWAREVTFDYGTKNVVRVDFMKFSPEDQMTIGGIEKGKFSCYEVKSCKADFKSGFGQNYLGEYNYLVMTMDTYKQVIHELPMKVGVLVAIPASCDKRATLLKEFDNPTPIDGNVNNWCLTTVISPQLCSRKRSMVEMLFCMLRSGK